MITHLPKSIGGYFELECGATPQYHTGGVLLNSARNALRYIIHTYRIQTLHVPYYTCPVVWQVVQSEKCKIMPYDITMDFMPNQKFQEDDFILYNNYFGVCGKKVQDLSNVYQNLIIDNAQAFYSSKKGLASFYSPRKFFGLPDGGIALCNKQSELKLEQDTSYNICSHLLKRLDLGATVGYSDFQENDNSLIGRDIKQMSRLTQALMGNIDYEKTKNIRLKNFTFLHQNLKTQNQLHLSLSVDDVPMVYPFMTHDPNLRTKMIKNCIFVARYWPEEHDCHCMTSVRSQQLANTIIPLPIDQRYNLDDMKHILEVIND